MSRALEEQLAQVNSIPTPGRLRNGRLNPRTGKADLTVELSIVARFLKAALDGLSGIDLCADMVQLFQSREKYMLLCDKTHRVLPYIDQLVTQASKPATATLACQLEGLKQKVVDKMGEVRERVDTASEFRDLTEITMQEIGDQLDSDRQRLAAVRRRAVNISSELAIRDSIPSPESPGAPFVPYTPTVPAFTAAHKELDTVLRQLRAGVGPLKASVLFLSLQIDCYEMRAEKALPTSVQQVQEMASQLKVDVEAYAMDLEEVNKTLTNKWWSPVYKEVAKGTKDGGDLLKRSRLARYGASIGRTMPGTMLGSPSRSSDAGIPILSWQDRNENFSRRSNMVNDAQAAHLKPDSDAPGETAALKDLQETASTTDHPALSSLGESCIAQHSVEANATGNPAPSNLGEGYIGHHSVDTASADNALVETQLGLRRLTIQSNDTAVSPSNLGESYIGHHSVDTASPDNALDETQPSWRRLTMQTNDTAVPPTQSIEVAESAQKSVPRKFVSRLRPPTALQATERPTVRARASMPNLRQQENTASKRVGALASQTGYGRGSITLNYELSGTVQRGQRGRLSEIGKNSFENPASRGLKERRSLANLSNADINSRMVSQRRGTIIPATRRERSRIPVFSENTAHVLPVANSHLFDRPVPGIPKTPVSQIRVPFDVESSPYLHTHPKTPRHLASVAEV